MDEIRACSQRYYLANLSFAKNRDLGFVYVSFTMTKEQPKCRFHRLRLVAELQAR
jgi:hypothetical protein